MTATQVPQKVMPFPRLRQDLVFSQAPHDTDQAARFVLADLLRHKYFHIGQSELEEMSAAAPLEEKSSALVNFLVQSELIVVDKPAAGTTFSERAKKTKHGIFTAALHGYLIFRIPLVNPEPLQRKLWPFASLFFKRPFIAATLVAFILGLFLISRRWDEFAAGLTSMMSFSGLALFALAFAVIKLFHEMGHAFMAYRFGVAVPTVGVAFMLFYPVLYTETSAAWRLPKRQRMWIGAAGMLVELLLAVWASLLWVFVPDGMTRSLLLAIATTGWILTLAVNLNPLMRFDGYFLASDLVCVPNLQDRSFALARWALREWLFASRQPKPEAFSTAMTAGLIAFAIATWIYRFFLFLGIAVLVYHFTVKLLGIFLFAVEIAWFIVLPIWREVRHWWKNRADYFKTFAAKRSLMAFIALLALFFLPFSRTISVPALLTAGQYEQLHSKTEARIRRSYLREGMTVRTGDILLELDLPDLDFELAQAEASVQLAKTKLMRLAADAESRSQRQVIEEEMGRAIQKRDSVLTLANDRIIRAPFDGMIVNVEPALRENRWIGPSTMLAVIKSVQGGKIQALATDVEVNRLTAGASAHFVPDDFMAPALKATLVEIEKTGSAHLPNPELADIHGGLIATLPSQNGKTVPMTTYTKLLLSPLQDSITVAHLLRGVVHITASKESIATRVLRRIAAVLILESGF